MSDDEKNVTHVHLSDPDFIEKAKGRVRVHTTPEQTEEILRNIEAAKASRGVPDDREAARATILTREILLWVAGRESMYDDHVGYAKADAESLLDGATRGVRVPDEPNGGNE